MAQPIYFLPHLRKAAADSAPLRKSVLKERGLADIFSDLPLEQQPIAELPGRGPGGLPGCLLCYQTPAGDVPRRWGYYPAEQSWTPVGDGSLLWIGLDSAEPVKPEEIARPRPVRGYSLELAGQTWTIPVIRRPPDAEFQTLLPRAFTRNAAGQQVETVRSAYQHYWDDFRAAAEWCYGGMEPGAFDQDQAVDLAIRALGINYRFGWEEQNVLQVVDSDNYLLILAAAVDLPTFEASIDPQKKMNGHSVEPSSTPGPAADCPDISPVGATCS